MAQQRPYNENQSKGSNQSQSGKAPAKGNNDSSQTKGNNDSSKSGFSNRKGEDRDEADFGGSTSGNSNDQQNMRNRDQKNRPAEGGRDNQRQSGQSDR